MLAGYSSSSLLSPTRRLRSEAVAATVSVHFPMNTQRLDLPYSSSFSRKETPSLGRNISLDNNKKPIERKTGGCSLKQSIKLPPLATTRGNTQGFSWNNDSNNRGKKSLKRLAEENKDESCLSRVKKRQRSQTGDDDDDHNRRFWFDQNSAPALPFSLTCSGYDDEEEKVWFAPSEVISQPLQSNNPNWANSVITELAGIGGHKELRFLNQVTPIPKFIHYTANEMLLRAFEGKERVHVIDFDIKQGLQWPSFFQTLASKPNPPRHVQITGVGESKHELEETGDRLRGFAEAMDLPFEFHPIIDRLEHVRLWMLHVKEGEAVAVNCVSQMHKTLHDGTGAAFRSFVGLVRSTNPVAVVVAEQEGEHDSVRLEGRVFNSLKYYSAVFDVMHKHLGADSLVRAKIEEMVFGREIRNIVACEGSHRREIKTQKVIY